MLQPVECRIKIYTCIDLSRNNSLVCGAYVVGFRVLGHVIHSFTPRSLFQPARSLRRRHVLLTFSVFVAREHIVAI